VVPLLNRLLQGGQQVRVYDPHIQLEKIYGSNRNFAVASIPRMETVLEPSLKNLLAWASHVVLTQNPAPGEAAQIQQSGLPILDLAGGSAKPSPPGGHDGDSTRG
jgi:GDP-mannose 6-dehydrogenase